MARYRSRLDNVLERLESGEVAEIDSVAEHSRQVNLGEPGEERGVGWSVLGKMILRTIQRRSFLSAIVYGKQGAGKSVYAIKVAYDVLRQLGRIPANSRYREVYKRYMVFSAKHLLRIVREAKGSPVPVLIWDDAGVHGGAYLFFSDPFLAKAISDVFRVIRTRVYSLLLTTPSPGDVLKPLRSYDTVIVYVHEVDDWWSRAHIYQMRLLPSGAARIWKVAIEDFKRYIPSYSDYLEVRDRYVDEALDALEELLRRKELERALARAKLLMRAEKLREKAVRAGVDIDDIDVIVEYRDDA